MNEGDRYSPPFSFLSFSTTFKAFRTDTSMSCTPNFLTSASLNAIVS